MLYATLSPAPEEICYLVGRCIAFSLARYLLCYLIRYLLRILQRSPTLFPTPLHYPLRRHGLRACYAMHSTDLRYGAMGASGEGSESTRCSRTSWSRPATSLRTRTPLPPYAHPLPPYAHPRHPYAHDVHKLRCCPRRGGVCVR